MKFFNFLLLFTLTVPLSAHKIGLLVVATGKYIKFVQPLLDSAKKHFCAKHEVTYFIFTDGQAPQDEHVVSIFQKKLGWPYDTMMRFSIYNHNKDQLKDMDYLFACDADMLFVDEVGDEILGDRVGTVHPGYVNQKGTPETRSQSTAYIAENANHFYYAGGFNGGSCQEFLAMTSTIAHNVDQDLHNGIVAIWHDESHLNRYFLDHTPTVILNPSYCYPESLHLPYKKKLLALDKNHNHYRS